MCVCVCVFAGVQKRKKQPSADSLSHSSKITHTHTQKTRYDHMKPVLLVTKRRQLRHFRLHLNTAQTSDLVSPPNKTSERSENMLKRSTSRRHSDSANFTASMFRVRCRLRRFWALACISSCHEQARITRQCLNTLPFLLLPLEQKWEPPTTTKKRNEEKNNGEIERAQPTLKHYRSYARWAGGCGAHRCCGKSAGAIVPSQ